MLERETRFREKQNGVGRWKYVTYEKEVLCDENEIDNVVFFTWRLWTLGGKNGGLLLWRFQHALIR